MDMVLIRFHYVDAEVGTQFDECEDFLDRVLHEAFKQAFPIFTDEYQMALEIPFVPSRRGVATAHNKIGLELLLQAWF